MIKVGINENVFLKSAAIDPEKGRLTIVWSEIADKPFDPFESLQDDEVKEPASSLETNLFPPKLGDKAMEKSAEKRTDMARADLNSTKGILQHIMKQYMTIDQMPKLGAVMFNGLPIDKDNFDKQIQKPEILEGAFRNMANQFIAAMKPFMGDQNLKMRLLLVRQSKEKHFATFRNKYLDENPFLESMDIPTGVSKVKFTKYETDFGLNDGTPIARDAADKPAPGNANTQAGSNGGQALTVDNVFSP